MRLIGNILWLLFGGILIVLEYLISSILLMVTIIGIPFGIQTLKLAGLAIWPFGRKIVYTEKPSGCLNILMNLLWLLLGGLWIALSHVLIGVILSITIIGIPFGQQHFKMAALALSPFGAQIE
jgi:uncharacterized membrane protein YccF (DUF307 family)